MTPQPGYSPVQIIGGGGRRTENVNVNKRRGSKEYSIKRKKSTSHYTDFQC